MKNSESGYISNSSNKNHFSAFIFKNLLILFLLGTLLTSVLSIAVIPGFERNSSWHYLLAAVFSYGLTIPLFFLLIHRKTNYLKTIRKHTDAFKNSEKISSLPVIGEDDLSQLAQNINLLYQALEAESQSVAYSKQEHHQLINRISNELYPLITTLSGYLERMEKTADSKTQKQYLLTILRKSDEIHHFIEDILNNAFSDNQSAFYEFKVYNGQPLIQKLINQVTIYLEEAGFEVILENCIDQNFSLWVDYQQLQRVLNELISNIIKFADAQKPIHLGLILNKNELCFILRNKTLPYAEEALKPESPSLEVCQKIIERHQGRIDYYHLNQMFKVELTLPIHQNKTLESKVQSFEKNS